MHKWDKAWHSRLRTIIASLPEKDLETQSAIRRELGKDPLAFAIIYMSRVLKIDGKMSFSDVHYDWCVRALKWADKTQEPSRFAFIAPRSMGKSSWWFLILPLWAAANGHSRVAVAFAHSTGQAEGRLQVIKNELENNTLLRTDYPLLCTPAKKQSGGTVADRQGKIEQANGFSFAAKGVDSQSLGMASSENIRPDWICFDDCEPDEGRYSDKLAEKRLGTIVEALLPLNDRARVVLVGTVTMPGSIAHQVVKAAQNVEVADWIKDEGFECFHYLPIVTNPDGTERSVWPEKWSLEKLQSIKHTRSYAKNFLNDPRARDGDFWTSDDFKYGTSDTLTHMTLFLDPALTAKTTSDWTGWAVVGYSSVEKKVYMIDAGHVKLVNQDLVRKLEQLLTIYPRVNTIRIEVNAGGDLWHSVLKDIKPLVKRFEVHTVSESKEVRAARTLALYQTGQVFHVKQLDALEEEMVGFPKAAHDDILDAACSGVLAYLEPEAPQVARYTTV